MFPLLGKLRLGQFLVAALRNDACPLRLVCDVVHCETDFRVRPHPFSLLSVRREDVYVARLVDIINRDHIGLVIKRAAEPSERSAGQNRPTLFLFQFIDHHDSDSLHFNTQHLTRTPRVRMALWNSAPCWDLLLAPETNYCSCHTSSTNLVL